MFRVIVFYGKLETESHDSVWLSFSKRYLIVSSAFCVLFKVAVLTNIRSKIQKGAVTEPDHEVTKANVFRLQLLKDKLHVSTLTDSW